MGEFEQHSMSESDYTTLNAVDLAALSESQKLAIAQVLKGQATLFSNWVQMFIANQNQEEPTITDTAAGTGKRKRGAPKDPNRVKKPPTPYNVYVRRNCAAWKKAHTDGTQPEGGIMKHAAQGWADSFMNAKSDNYNKEKTDKLMAKQPTPASTPTLTAAVPASTPSSKKKKKQAEGDEEDDAATEKKRRRKEKKLLEKQRKAEAEDSNSD